MQPFLNTPRWVTVEVFAGLPMEVFTLHASFMKAKMRKENELINLRKNLMTILANESMKSNYE